MFRPFVYLDKKGASERSIQPQERWTAIFPQPMSRSWMKFLRHRPGWWQKVKRHCTKETVSSFHIEKKNTEPVKCYQNSCTVGGFPMPFCLAGGCLRETVRVVGVLNHILNSKFYAAFPLNPRLWVKNLPPEKQKNRKGRVSKWCVPR